jgi:ribosomal protein S18 acetylase RimI-like enzyme
LKKYFSKGGGIIKFRIAKIDTDTRKFVVNYICENWGSSVIVTRGKVHNTVELPGFVALVDGEVKGIITYNIENNECEIVSLDSLYENCGVGSELINQVINEANINGCKRVWLITTNDNTHTIRYYQKRGFNMVTIHRNAINESRKIKPQIPLTGFDGIPILHEIEFEKML